MECLNVKFIYFYSTLLENFCTILYDAFRPLIIHMNHMETLTELCSILKVNNRWNKHHHNNIHLYNIQRCSFYPFRLKC